MEPLTFAEAQDIVEIGVNVGPAQMVAETLSGNEPPTFIVALRGMIAGIQLLQSFVRQGHSDEEDCANPACHHATQHQKFKDTMKDSVSAVENAVQQLKHDTAMYLYEFSNCDCRPCKEDALRGNASNN